MMKQNESSKDRKIRVILGIGFTVAGFFWLTGVIQTIVLVLGAIALVTGFFGFCPLYAVLGISSCKVKKQDTSKENG